MNFFIKKNSLLPHLVLECVEPVNPTDTKIFYQRLLNADINFYMDEFNSCMPYIQCMPCVVCEEKQCGDCESKYYIVYKWNEGDTAKVGQYKGWIDITFRDNGENLITPIKSELIIKII